MSVRLEASLEKRLETLWPVRNSELLERRFSSLSLAVIIDLVTDAAPLSGQSSLQYGIYLSSNLFAFLYILFVEHD